LSESPRSPWAAEGGAAVVEFVLVSAVAVALTMALAQLGLFLWERNALMGSLSEGTRVAATEGRTVDDGRRVATELLHRAIGGRVAGAVLIQAEGTLPSFVPGVPGLPVRMTARMHEEESL
jgi:TadE-like protein